MWRCPECGIQNKSALVCGYCGKRAPAGSTTDSPSADWSIRKWRYFLGLAAGGVLFLMIGGTLLAAPFVADAKNPVDPSFVAGGFGLTLGGGMNLFFAWLLIRPRRQS